MFALALDSMAAALEHYSMVARIASTERDSIKASSKSKLSLVSKAEGILKGNARED